MEVVGKFFAFVTLIAILIVVIALINKPVVLKDILIGFNNYLGTLSASVAGTPFRPQNLP